MVTALLTLASSLQPRSAVRESAMLVRRELSDAHGAIEYATSLAQDEAVAEDLRSSIDKSMLTMEMWRRHWPTLADSLTRGEWQTVTTAYASVGHVIRVSANGDEALASAARAAYEPVRGGYRVLRDSRAL